MTIPSVMALTGRSAACRGLLDAGEPLKTFSRIIRDGHSPSIFRPASGLTIVLSCGRR